MRSGRRVARAVRLAAALAALAAGCGSWSNDDVAFVMALPSNEVLRLRLPASTGQALCAAPGSSEVWAWAKPTGDGLNAMVDGLLALVDLVKSAPPTTRAPDRRVWGPWGDDKHAGFEVRVTMTRSWADQVPTYAYVFEERPRGGAWSAVLDGSFTGASARSGKGEFVLHFEDLRLLGIDEHPDTDPYGPLTVQYDRTGDPRTVGADVPTGPQGGIAEFDYGYAGYLDGNGEFDYVFVNGQAQRYEVRARFDATGAGKADVTVVVSATSSYQFSECWDAAGCVTDVQDASAMWLPAGVSGLCTNHACPRGACPAL